MLWTVVGVVSKVVVECDVRMGRLEVGGAESVDMWRKKKKDEMLRKKVNVTF